MNWNFDTSELTSNQSELVTDVMVSLFTDRRALDSDELPNGSTDKRGFWADSFNDNKIGSRLWLLSREKQKQSVLDKAKEYAEEALQWLLDDKRVQAINVSATSPISSVLLLEITITQNSGEPVLNFSFKADLNAV